MSCEEEIGSQIPKMESSSLWDRLQEENSYPLSVLVSLTDRCPLSCPHCYITERRAEGELTLEELSGLFEELASLGTLRLTLTGGEVGLRDDLLQIVAEAHRRHFAVTLKTSAALFDESDIEALRGAGVSELHVSLYHPEPERHDAFVGMEGSWSKAVRALDVFRDLGGVSRANAVLMSWNAGAMSHLVDLCEAHRWTYVVDPRLVLNNEADGSTRALRAGSDVLDGMMNDLRFTRQSGFNKISSMAICGAVDRAAYVATRGELCSCPDLFSLPWGNIREQSFAEIWDTSPARKKLREVLRWGRSPKCLECGHLYYCTRCPGDAFLEHGDIEKPASFDCLLAAAVGRTRR